MTPTQRTLVKVYAHHDVEDVRKDKTLIEDAFGQTLEELDVGNKLSLARDFVAEIKLRVETRKNDWWQPDPKVQVGGALRLIWEIVLFDRSPKSTVDLRMEVMKEIFLEIFKGDWTDTQVAHVEFVVDMLKGWNSFFVSYTNRSPKKVNDLYKDVIETFVEPTIRATRDWEKDNLLADAIVGVLRRENLLNGFYDKINIQWSDNLEQKIGPAAGGSFMFVQLVQRDIFTTAPAPNWCFEEYQIFQRLSERVLKEKQREDCRDAFRKRFAPVVIDDVRPAVMPFEYQPWATRIFKEQRYEKLPVEPQEFDDTVHKLALEIVNLHGQIIDSVPA